MEQNTDERALETKGIETAAQGCDSANYYPGMLADLEDREMERRDRIFEQEFFGDAECADVVE